MSESPLKVWRDRDGRLLRLRLARPKANLIDAEMIAALDEAFAGSLDMADLNGVLLDHEGPHFSFGASVEEHLPDQCADMLKGLHRLVGRMVECPVPVLVAVRDQCLGGGLEVASAGGLIFAAPDAALGQPEIKLAVFAPAASCLLPERVGRAHAEDLLFSGRSVTGEEAAAMGLVHTVAEDPEAAALAYFDERLAPLSASSLRFAVRAVRAGFAARVKARLAEVEELYGSGLMRTRDAVEGLEAFLEKRPAVWENR
ncbi:MAG: cyclohexa-1,5-dienecarbonyl-CoA hydratase [Nitrospinota bacterium]